MSVDNKILSNISLAFLLFFCFVSLDIMPSERSYQSCGYYRKIQVLKPIPEVVLKKDKVIFEIDSQIQNQQLAWNDALDNFDVDSAHDRAEKIKELLSKKEKLLRRDSFSGSTY